MNYVNYVSHKVTSYSVRYGSYFLIFDIIWTRKLWHTKSSAKFTKFSLFLTIPLNCLFAIDEWAILFHSLLWFMWRDLRDESTSGVKVLNSCITKRWLQELFYRSQPNRGNNSVIEMNDVHTNLWKKHNFTAIVIAASGLEARFYRFCAIYP